jgi:hypothetical protein
MVLEKLVTDDESRKQVVFLRDSSLKRNVISRAIELGLESAEKPLLAVIPRNCMETRRQMSFISFNGEKGIAELSLDKVNDVDEKLPHHHPYWAFGISIGMETLNRPARLATLDILAENRKPLTLAESIALQIQFPSIVDLVSINACGSCYRKREDGTVENVPAIYVCNKYPTATWNHIDRNKNEGVRSPWVSPSCLERMGNLGVMTYIQCRYWRKRRERK